MFLYRFFSSSFVLISYLAFSFLLPVEALAQCNSSGCVSQPVFLVPSAAQDISIELRRTSLQTVLIQESPQPVFFKPSNSPLPPTTSQGVVRTWSNGEGQWRNLSNGSACLVSNSSKSIVSSPQCSETF